jgi:hypothetical protein
MVEQPGRLHLNFAKIATQAFAFLTSVGFSQVEAAPTIVRYRRGDVGADVYHGRQSYELGFEVGRGETRYSMSELIRAADAEAAKRYRVYAATTQAGVIEGLRQLADLARQYGTRALQGDGNFYAALEKQRSSRAQEYALDVLASQLRPKAEEAFRHGSYLEAAKLLERIRPLLTLAELKKLAIAKGRAQT